jgi:hypothetical protein
MAAATLVEAEVGTPVVEAAVPMEVAGIPVVVGTTAADPMADTTDLVVAATQAVDPTGL